MAIALLQMPDGSYAPVYPRESFRTEAARRLTPQRTSHGVHRWDLEVAALARSIAAGCELGLGANDAVPTRGV